MHSRPPVPYEDSLVAGIAGLIGNRVTKCRSIMGPDIRRRSFVGPDMQYYPTFTRVTDSFGNELTSHKETGLEARLSPSSAWAPIPKSVPCHGNSEHTLAVAARSGSTAGEAKGYSRRPRSDAGRASPQLRIGPPL
jgi:hypothetical protein